MKVVNRGSRQITSTFERGEDNKFFVSNSKEIQSRIGAILRNMYQNPIWAVVREYVANALDADLTKNILVTLPTADVLNFVVRDYGPGMSRSVFIDSVTGYGVTSKLGDEGSIGGFGIGSKCALAYTDSYTYANRYIGDDGVLRCIVMTCYLDDKHEPAYTIVYDGEAEDGDKTGLEVTIPVTASDILRFHSSMQSFALVPDTLKRIDITTQATIANVKLADIGGDDGLKSYYGETKTGTDKGVTGLTLKEAAVKNTLDVVNETTRTVEVGPHKVGVTILTPKEEDRYNGYYRVDPDIPLADIVNGNRIHFTGECRIGGVNTAGEIIVVLNGVPYPVSPTDLVAACPRRLMGLSAISGSSADLFKGIIISVDGSTDLEPTPSRETIMMSPVGANFLANCLLNYHTVMLGEYRNDPEGFGKRINASHQLCTAFIFCRSAVNKPTDKASGTGDASVVSMSEWWKEAAETPRKDTLYRLHETRYHIDISLPQDMVVFGRTRYTGRYSNRSTNKFPYFTTCRSIGNNSEFTSSNSTTIHTTIIYGNQVPQHVMQRAACWAKAYIKRCNYTEQDDLDADTVFRDRLYTRLMGPLMEQRLRTKSKGYSSWSDNLAVYVMQQARYDLKHNKIVWCDCAYKDLGSLLPTRCKLHKPEYYSAQDIKERNARVRDSHVYGSKLDATSEADKSGDDTTQTVEYPPPPEPKYAIVTLRGRTETGDVHLYGTYNSKGNPEPRAIAVSSIDNYVSLGYNNVNDNDFCRMVEFIETGAIDDLGKIAERPHIAEYTPAVFYDKVLLPKGKKRVTKPLYYELYKKINTYYNSRPKFVKDWLVVQHILEDYNRNIRGWGSGTLTHLWEYIYAKMGPGRCVKSALMAEGIALLTGAEKLTEAPTLRENNRFLKQLTNTDIWLGGLLFNHKIPAALECCRIYDTRGALNHGVTESYSCEDKHLSDIPTGKVFNDILTRLAEKDSPLLQLLAIVYRVAENGCKGYLLREAPKHYKKEDIKGFEDVIIPQSLIKMIISSR